jgi:flavorubredoxin
MTNQERNYERPIEVADKIYWVGFQDRTSDLHCNPYLVLAGDQAVLIDAGSRPHFAVVMMKILQTGIAPEQIVALIYHHIDPDLCGSLSNMIDICTNPELKIISAQQNNIFLSYYIEREKRALLKSAEEYGNQFTFGGRTLTFYKTPYAHTAGSFVTYDIRTKTLFTSDLFGSISKQWDLFAQLADDCYVCKDHDRCILGNAYCPLPDIWDFHREVMPSGSALRHAADVMKELDIERIAPQHGSVFTKKGDIDFLIQKLGMLDRVGIDGIR